MNTKRTKNKTVQIAFFGIEKKYINREDANKRLIELNNSLLETDYPFSNNLTTVNLSLKEVESPHLSENGVKVFDLEGVEPEKLGLSQKEVPVIDSHLSAKDYLFGSKKKLEKIYRLSVDAIRANQGCIRALAYASEFIICSSENKKPLPICEDIFKFVLSKIKEEHQRCGLKISLETASKDNFAFVRIARSLAISYFDENPEFSIRICNTMIQLNPNQSVFFDLIKTNAIMKAGLYVP